MSVGRCSINWGRGIEKRSRRSFCEGASISDQFQHRFPDRIRAADFLQITRGVVISGLACETEGRCRQRIGKKRGGGVDRDSRYSLSHSSAWRD